jgi:hypothetical protein
MYDPGPLSEGFFIFYTLNSDLDFCPFNSLFFTRETGNAHENPENKKAAQDSKRLKRCLIFLCGPDGTRTRDLCRDRAAF